VIIGGKKILRVFPQRTSMTPADDMVAIGIPGIFDMDKKMRREADEVHVSCAFRWDKKLAERLGEIWSSAYENVKVGGPAFGDKGDEFTPGLYVKRGVTFTSRGCPNSGSGRCPWCLVSAPFREIEIKPGNIIQDNNILASSDGHFAKVIDMLNAERLGAYFKGGLESRRLSDFHVDQFARLRTIKELWFACDNAKSFAPLQRAIEKLRRLQLGRRKLRCYVMIGFSGESVASAAERLQAIWDIGMLPFSQLYRGPDEVNFYSQEWLDLNREWSRPAAMYATQEKK